MKKRIKVFISLIILYSLFLLGNWIQDLFHLFIPGSVIGMLVLFGLLQTNIIKINWIVDGMQPFLKHLTLFFIPVTVGFIEYLELFSGRGFLLLVITLISTLLVMGLSGFVSQYLAGRKD